MKSELIRYIPTDVGIRYDYYPLSYLGYKGVDFPQVTTRYYRGNPYITSYTNRSFDLLRRTPIHTVVRARSVDREVPETYAYRAMSMPPRAASPVRSLTPYVSSDTVVYRARSTSVPRGTTDTAITDRPVISYTPRVVRASSLDRDIAPVSSYAASTYFSPVEGEPFDIHRMKLRYLEPTYTTSRIATPLAVSAYRYSPPLDVKAEKPDKREKEAPLDVYKYSPYFYYNRYPRMYKTTYTHYQLGEKFPRKYVTYRLTYPSLYPGYWYNKYNY